MEHHEHLDKYDKDFGNPLSGFEGAQIGTMMAKIASKKDAYDHDPTSVSPYDGQEVHNYVDKYQKDYGIENDLSQVHRR